MAILFWTFATALPVSRFLNVLNDTVRDAPPDEIELGNSGRQTLEVDASRSTKRIKEFLRVPIQTRLVGHMDREHFAVWGCVRHVAVLGIVRHEPLQFPK